MSAQRQAFQEWWRIHYDDVECSYAEARIIWQAALSQQAPVSADAIYDEIKVTLANHRLSYTEGSDGEAYPLADALSTPGGTIKSGVDEIVLICDAIYNEVLTPMLGKSQSRKQTEPVGAEAGELPPLPRCSFETMAGPYFDILQMQAYAKAAIAQSRAQVVPAEPVARVRFRKGRMEPIVDWMLNVSVKDGASLYFAAQAVSELAEPFQSRVQPWMLACFGAEIAADKTERSHRFVEEALELAQACGTTASEAHQLVDYVFGRPAGEMDQEVGGVMVTLAALCLAQGLDMAEAADRELARIWTKVEQIRAKQAAKPKHSPLPAAAPSAPIEPIYGFLREDLDGIASGLEAEPQTVSIGDVTGMGEEHLQTTAAAAAKFIRRALAATAPIETTPPAMAPRTSERDWPEDFSGENGNYMNRCADCKLTFFGHKRRVVCKVCSAAPAEPTPEQIQAAQALHEISDERIDAMVDKLGELDSFRYTPENWRAIVRAAIGGKT